MQVFDAEAVRRLSPMPALVRALERAFREGAEVPQRHAHALPGGASLLLMPAWRAAAGGDVADSASVDRPREGADDGSRRGARLGIKAVTIHPGNGALGLPGVHGLYCLFDAATGVPLAVLDGSELTARRTAAASALAAKYLARRDARRLVVVGAGRVAALLPEAMQVACPRLAEVLVWARRPDAAAALVRELLEAGWCARAETDLAAAVHAADIVSCATLSTAPLVRGAWLAPRTHLDLIGSFTPAMRETDGACFERARVWVDTAEALAKAGDVLQAVAEGCFDAARVEGTLADLVRGGGPRAVDAAAAAAAAPARRDCTLFKSVGNAIEDLAAAELVVDGPG